MNKKHWIIFSIIVISSAIFAYRYFDQAIPFVRVPITMNNHQARDTALQLANQYKWSVDDFDIVTMYQQDSQLQAFVELEGGGKQAFIEMIEKNYFQPYQWRVRFYKEHEIKEVFVGFTPTGQPYEFLIKLPENLQGSVLSKQQALDKAEQGVVSWGVDLNNYQLVEYHSEEVVSGRIDHEFIYERKDVFLNKGKYRLKLKVSGDLFSSLQHFVKIPDEFYKRYEQMYATNKMLAGLARNIAFFLYLFIFGLFIFIFFFHRKHAMLLMPVTKVMGICAVLLLLNELNLWMLEWNQYQTHVSSLVFIFEKIFETCAQVIYFTFLLGFIVLTAEVAGRYVFKNHLQFFKLWNWSSLGSYQVLQQTLLGYGFAIIFFGYMVCFSLFAQAIGWWAPLSTLIDPNVLSTRIPCFSPLVTALKAGFFEEYLCRALPLAGVLLCARNSKHKNILFVLVFIAQILIFGTWHASYPQQPAYYRIVELIFDGVAFGGLYYYFGLLPGIVAHFVYDAVLMSLPVFVSDLFHQKLLAVFIILIPLLLIFITWLRQARKFKNISDDAYNASWTFLNHTSEDVDLKRPVGTPIEKKAKYAALLFATLGLILWFYSKDFEIDTVAIQITQAQAEDIARKTIENHFGLLDSTWTLTRDYFSPKSSMGGKFVWQTFGKQGYEKLQGSYIRHPGYFIKFVKFSGPVENRAEVYEVFVQADRSVNSIRHAVPEFWPGSDLSEQEAHDNAYKIIQEIYGLQREDLQVVVSQSVKHDQRRDWTVIMKDIKNYPFDVGQARIIIQIAGDKLADIARFVYPSEDWQRNEQSRMGNEKLLHAVLNIIKWLWILCFIGIALNHFGISMRYFSAFLLLTGSYIVLNFLNCANNWFDILYNFSTAEPFTHQIINFLGYGFVRYLAIGSVLAILLLSCVFLTRRLQQKKLFSSLPLGLALGTGFFGVFIFLKQFQPSFAPECAYYSFSNSVNPLLAILLSYFILEIVVVGCTIQAFFVTSEKIITWVGFSWLHPFLFILAGIVLFEPAQLTNIFVWLCSGSLLGLVWYFIYRYFMRHDYDLIWIMLITMYILQLVSSVWFRSYPGIQIHVFVSSAAILAFIAWLYKKI